MTPTLALLRRKGLGCKHFWREKEGRTIGTQWTLISGRSDTEDKHFVPNGEHMLDSIQGGKIV